MKTLHNGVVFSIFTVICTQISGNVLVLQKFFLPSDPDLLIKSYHNYIKTNALEIYLISTFCLTYKFINYDRNKRPRNYFSLFAISL